MKDWLRKWKMYNVRKQLERDICEKLNVSRDELAKMHISEVEKRLGIIPSEREREEMFWLFNTNRILRKIG